jgi:hypothetical protein
VHKHVDERKVTLEKYIVNTFRRVSKEYLEREGERGERGR